MTTPRFIPFDLGDDDVEEFFALTEELSEATMQLLRDWIITSYGRHGYLDSYFLVDYASRAKISLNIQTGQGLRADGIRYHFPYPKKLLGFIHYLLFLESRGDSVDEVNMILLNGHAAWTVSEEDFPNPRKIVRRLPKGVAEAVREVASKSQLAGRQLTKAWNNAFSLDQDPSVAYSSAIKAVETLACPMIDPGATLGRAIGKLYKEANDWSFVLTEPKPHDRHPVVPVDVVASNMKMLWRGQVDRHGDDEPKSRDLTIEEARAAVLLAATLVGWLNDGYLAKR